MKKLFAVVVALTGMLLLTYGAQGQAQAQGADDAGQVEAGQAVYAASCAGCHGDDGTGVAGQGRPLIGIASQGDRETHVASITGGKGGMPAFGPRISVDEIEQAASYVRLTFVDDTAAAQDDSEDEAELAETGVGATGLAIVGVTMLIGGLQLVVFSRRDS